MEKHIHGGNIYSYRDCVDFSANCNPLGTPESVKQAIRDSLECVKDYPQVGYAPLREALGRYEDVEPEYVICGNGAAELIFSLCQAVKPKRALVPAPSFAEYEQALLSTGCQVEHVYLKKEDGFCIQEDFIRSLHKDLDMVFLCNPNNPTGILTEREFLFRVLRYCRELGILLVVDECFLDFVKEPGKYSLKAQLPRYHNLFILKAFTKRYAMAGIRECFGNGSGGRDRGFERDRVCGGGTEADLPRSSMASRGTGKTWSFSLSLSGKLSVLSRPGRAF